MQSDGGGWTLVASIHENNAHDNGRCTVGDKWSSEQGNNELTNHGDGNWENLKTFGNVASATSDDFKSLAYFSIDDAKDIMIWQVPNNTPLSMWRSNSYLRYRTYGHFLTSFGGNLQNLFQSYYPIRQGVYNPASDNGPSFQAKYDEGSPADTLSHFGTGIQAYLTAGYIQVIQEFFGILPFQDNAFFCDCNDRKGLGLSRFRFHGYAKVWD
uniref:Intelectin-1-like n=1 Tax=Phallusia mammillata TaxID=59560 RepID=A0A6F9DFY0_9ASCI|nr:intelectin-1-like [Phallusia mammillata]